MSNSDRRPVPKLLGDYLREMSVLLLVFGGLLERAGGLRITIMVSLSLVLLVAGLLLDRRN